jgi:hypothetical protein
VVSELSSGRWSSDPPEQRSFRLYHSEDEEEQEEVDEQEDDDEEEVVEEDYKSAPINGQQDTYRYSSDPPESPREDLESFIELSHRRHREQPLLDKRDPSVLRNAPMVVHKTAILPGAPDAAAPTATAATVVVPQVSATDAPFKHIPNHDAEIDLSHCQVAAAPESAAAAAVVQPIMATDAAVKRIPTIDPEIHLSHRVHKVTANTSVDPSRNKSSNPQDVDIDLSSPRMAIVQPVTAAAGAAEAAAMPPPIAPRLPSGQYINAKNTLDSHSIEFASVDDVPLDWDRTIHVTAATPIYPTRFPLSSPPPPQYYPSSATTASPLSHHQEWNPPSPLPPPPTPPSPSHGGESNSGNGGSGAHHTAATTASTEEGATEKPTLTDPNTTLDRILAQLQQWGWRKVGAVASAVVLIVIVWIAVAASRNSSGGSGAQAKRVPADTAMPPASAPPKDRGTLITEYINSVKLSTTSLMVPSKTTTSQFESVEQSALAWLIQDDPLQLEPGTVLGQFHILQRYALLTLLLQSDTNTTVDEGLDECDWPDIACVSRTINGMYTKVVTDIEISNDVDGYIPEDLGLLAYLERFDVGWESVSGSLPESIGRWTNLEYFSVWGNSLTGTLPQSIGQWTNLEHFDVEDNSLAGTIPTTIGAWSRITTAYFDENRFTGSMPSSICSQIGTTDDALTTLTANCDVDCSCCTESCS